MALARTPAVTAVPPVDPAWTVVVDESEAGCGPGRDVADSVLSIGDGRFGTRGAEETDADSAHLVTAAGVYDDWEENPGLLPAPIWDSLVMLPLHGSTRRVLDLRTGILYGQYSASGRTVRTARAMCLARPGLAVLHAEGPHTAFASGPTLRRPERAPFAEGERLEEGRAWASTRGLAHGGIVAVGHSAEDRYDGHRVLDRVVAFAADADDPFPRLSAAADLLERGEDVGAERLFDEQARAMAGWWRDAGVEIHGDARLTLAVRHALFHLLTSAGRDGEAAVGPRGMSGVAYGGHVMWDADVFVLPVLAALRPEAARAMLEYRIRRLDQARVNAAALGFAGARFPWESGRVGTDITPKLVRASGQLVPIVNGLHEEHITADVAWGAWQYWAWTGDDAFIDGPGGVLVEETARYWASRVRRDRGGRCHIYGVVGPDEYHEIVDDDAFTNGLVRWTLRRAAGMCGRPTSTVSTAEARAWRAVASELVDGYDRRWGVHEQFDGYWKLEPLLAGDVLTVPAMADEVLGRPRVRASQIVKQPAVLMLHHMIPDALPAESLLADLAFYGPRTAHGSSLSPAVHAAVCARAGLLGEALRFFRMACLLDLDDSTATTARGMHTATAGGVWQALVWGFAGIRPDGEVLVVDPRLPREWDGISLTLTFRGRQVRCTVEHDRIQVAAERPVSVRVEDDLVEVGPAGALFRTGGRRGRRR